MNEKTKDHQLVIAELVAAIQEMLRQTVDQRTSGCVRAKAAVEMARRLTVPKRGDGLEAFRLLLADIQAQHLDAKTP